MFDKKAEEVAADLNVALSTVYYWKSGEREISLSNLILLANYLGVSIEYLIGRSENDSKPAPLKCPSFGKRLREVMKEKGLTTYYLRKNHGYGSKHFENWDKGADPALSTLIELSDLLDCTIDYLVGQN